MLKYLKISLFLVFIALIFCSCGKKETPTVTAEPQTIIETDDVVETTTSAPASTAVQTTKPVDKVTEATTTKSTYGDSELVVDPNNKFIKAVVNKYNLNDEGLICTYSKKGHDNNFVFQFDGSKDSNGKLIRNAETLKYVYSVTADCKTICRTGGYTGNDGCTLANGLGVFLLSKQALIPNIQDQIDALS